MSPKTIHLVRHGQSTHNAQMYRKHGADGNDALYLDAPLTPTGASQARQLVPRMTSLNPDLLVCSPLTRATQTLFLAAGHLHRPIVVTPLCTERMAYACDIGSPVSELQRRFPMLDYSRVRPADYWWWTPSVPSSQALTLQGLQRHAPGAGRDVEPSPALRARAAVFCQWLKTRNENCIAVFAHGVFLRELTGEGLTNCQVKSITI